MFAVIGGLAAVLSARDVGRGQVVDVAIYEAVAALMESSMADYEVAGVLRGRSGSVLAGVAPSNVYPCADGSEVVIAANADAVFARLCAAMGRPEFASDPRFAGHLARGKNMEALDELISAWSSSFEPEQLLKVLADHSVPVGRIYTAHDMLADPHYAMRDMVIRMMNRNGLNIPMPGVVPKFGGTPARIRHPGPALGANTRDVLKDLVGLDRETIDALVAAGLLGVAEATDDSQH
jgi:formyl-CoA transferase/succinyl-CoA--D-citramalate CoA-transferase